MRAATCVDPGTADLSCTAKEPAPNAGPLCAPWEAHVAADVGQAIFLARQVLNTVLLPNLANGDPCKGTMGGVEGLDSPVWSDYLGYGNEQTCQYHRCYDTSDL